VCDEGKNEGQVGEFCDVLFARSGTIVVRTALFLRFLGFFFWLDYSFVRLRR
jgi:hypothetical protein